MASGGGGECLELHLRPPGHIRVPRLACRYCSSCLLDGSDRRSAEGLPARLSDRIIVKTSVSSVVKMRWFFFAGAYLFVRPLYTSYLSPSGRHTCGGRICRPLQGKPRGDEKKAHFSLTVRFNLLLICISEAGEVYCICVPSSPILKEAIPICVSL